MSRANMPVERVGSRVGMRLGGAPARRELWRFDSGSCFAALVGEERHGRWRLAPAGEIRDSSRRYRPGPLVLETDSETAGFG